MIVIDRLFGKVGFDGRFWFETDVGIGVCGVEFLRVGEIKER